MQSINQSNKPGFVNPAFASIFDSITRHMPAITFWGILGTYAVTAALNVWSIPLPIYISIPAAVAIQFGRFAIVFVDFLNPSGRKSSLPGIIATAATIVALIELAFSLQHLKMEGAEFWSMFLFGGMVVMFGYLLEINFIKKGSEAFGLTNEAQQGAATGLMYQAPAQPLPSPPPTPTVDVQSLQDEIEFLKNQIATQQQTPQLGNGSAKPGRPKKQIPQELLNGVSKSGNGNGH